MQRIYRCRPDEYDTQKYNIPSIMFAKCNWTSMVLYMGSNKQGKRERVNTVNFI